MPHIVVDDHQTVRLAAGHAELFFVNFAKQLALIEFDGAFQVAADFRPADIEDLGLEARAVLHAADQPGEAPPASLEPAQPIVVQDRIKLFADQHRVDGDDVAVEQCRAASIRRASPAVGPNQVPSAVVVFAGKEFGQRVLSSAILRRPEIGRKESHRGGRTFRLRAAAAPPIGRHRRVDRSRSMAESESFTARDPPAPVTVR